MHLHNNRYETTFDTQDKFFPNLDDCSSPSFRVEMEFMEHINREYNLWQAYPQYTDGLEAGILSVNPVYRGLGIAKALTQRTVQYARDAGFPLIRCDCSSLYSSRVCASTGFKVAYSQKYADYVVNGVRPMLPEAPHHEFVVYVLEL